MRTRSGFLYPAPAGKRRNVTGEDNTRRKILKMNVDWFNPLPDDVVVVILSKLSAGASCPLDFINALLTCKRFNHLGLDSLVLSKASQQVFAVKAKNWSESAHQFLQRCAIVGNVEACYTLGMIRFYCLQKRGNGAKLLAKAAIKSYAPALYSLAVIQFNGSGGYKTDKDLRAGISLVARAAVLGHIDSLRELGHCLQDGYGVKQNVVLGRRYIIQANAKELAAMLSSLGSPEILMSQWIGPSEQHRFITGSRCPLLSDFGCNVPVREVHQANQFLTEWFLERGGSPGTGLRLCSHVGCGRGETRVHEFRRCSVCGTVNYCSRACQALDWKLCHKAVCSPPLPINFWVDAADLAVVDGGDNMIIGEGINVS